MQALAILEAAAYGGCLCGLGVGEGKTLISFLIPAVVNKERPLLIMPAKLIEEKRLDFIELGKHWKATPPDMLSYEWISTHPSALMERNPDLIICDEVHKLKHVKSGVTKRVWKYLRSHPDTMFCGLSGTITTRSFHEWWHLQQWCLPLELQPLPVSWQQNEMWVEALDEKRNNRRPLGALEVFGKSLAEARENFGERLRQTPGVVLSKEGAITASLQINLIQAEFEAIEEPLAKMRKTWETPGGEEFSGGADLWRHARELANGFYYRWDPAPPEKWLKARREYHQFVRGILHGSRTFETPSQVANAFAKEKAVTTWKREQKKFQPHTKDAWLSDRVINYARQWVRRHSGLIWVEHTAVGQLFDLFDVPYFSSGGLDWEGHSIRNHKGPAAVSVKAIGEGFNLQRYKHNLVLNCTPKGDAWEQLIGRTHRSGQEAETVYVDVLCTVDEQIEGFKQAYADAEYTQSITDHTSKLCLADLIVTQERL